MFFTNVVKIIGLAMIEIARADYEAMVAHAQRDFPDECCGLLAGAADQVRRVYPMVNVEHSPSTYRVDPLDLLKVFQELDDTAQRPEEHRLEMVGIYHSHTHSEAYPSPTDVLYARGYPEAAYLIISLTDRAAPVARAFRIEGERICEEEVRVR